MTAYRFGFSIPRQQAPYRRVLRQLVLSSVMLAALAMPDASAFAQGADMQVLLDRMERLERDIRTLNRQIARGPVEAGAAGAAGAVGDASAPPPATSFGGGNASNVEFVQGENALARVTVRLGALEQEVRQATGLSEGMSHRIDQISARLDTLMTDLDYRLSRLEGSSPGSFSPQPSISTAPSSAAVSKVGEMAAPTSGAFASPSAQEGGKLGANGTYVPPAAGGGSLGSVSKSTLDQVMTSESVDAAPQTEPQTAPAEPLTAMASQAPAPSPAQETPPQTAPSATVPAVASVLPEGSPRERYQYAFGLMSQARYVEAEAALKAFIAEHGDDPLAANARYWLGESYYVRKSFMDAAQAFFEAYKTTPDGAKAPDSLLKLGMSMASLEKTEEACATFGKLRKEFIDLKPGLEKTLNRETKRLKCQ
ncbi:tol-pal system protein YbgF [Magnetovibrio sp.]|uniref:tol-pal system protein YbgF n=1 Tax=Magnetovibrio sp. TaxID=2024836 RepID=UPI002F93BD93